MRRCMARAWGDVAHAPTLLTAEFAAMVTRGQNRLRAAFNSNAAASDFVHPTSAAATSSTAMPTILAFERISKRFGAVVVASDLDLALAEGEALGIIGPNGAGKTTLFGIACGTVRPDA